MICTLEHGGWVMNISLQKLFALSKPDAGICRTEFDVGSFPSVAMWKAYLSITKVIVSKTLTSKGRSIPRTWHSLRGIDVVVLFKYFFSARTRQASAGLRNNPSRMLRSPTMAARHSRQTPVAARMPWKGRRATTLQSSSLMKRAECAGFVR